ALATPFFTKNPFHSSKNLIFSPRQLSRCINIQWCGRKRSNSESVAIIPLYLYREKVNCLTSVLTRDRRNVNAYNLSNE
ncbi:MAG: hypothetical protein ABI680_15355, partial [Chthoniobacteraceae bacterium]